MIGPVARLLGVDARAHRALVGLFLTLFRRSGTNVLRRGARAKPVGMGWVWLTYGVYGLFAASLAHPDLGVARFTYGSIVCGAALMLVGVAVVADFATLIVAPGDDEILFPLPLDSRTYLAARLSVAARHVAGISVAYGLVPAVAGAFRWPHQPAWAPLFLLSLVATGWLALVLAFAVYRVALRLLGGERLRTLVAFLPGIMSLALYLGPQLLLRAGAPSRIATYGEWAWLAPPAWLAAVPEAILGDRDPATLLCAALGVAVLPLSGYLLLRALAGGFLDDLRRLLAGGGAHAAVAGAPARPIVPSALARRLLFLRTPDALAGYLLHAGASRSRDARARTLPLLAMPIVFCIIGLVSPRGTAYGLVGPYMAGSAAATLWILSSYHENPDAAWLLAASPLRRYGQVAWGVAASILVRYVLPLGAIVLAVVVAGSRGPPLVALVRGLHGFVGAMLSLPLFLGDRKFVPFSRPFRATEGRRTVLPGLLNLLVLALVGSLHAVLAAVAPRAFFVSVPLFAAGLALWTWLVVRDLDAWPPDDLLPERTGPGAVTA